MTLLRTARAAVVALATCALIALAPLPASAATGGVVLLNCPQHAVTRPSSYILTCADANTVLTHLHWTRFGGTTAHASATFKENDCTPDCAAGHFVSYPVRVLAYRIRSTHGAEHYSRVLVHFVGKTPSWVHHHRTVFDVDALNPR